MEYTKYEKARMIGARALQIAMGAPFLVDLKKGDLEKIKYNPIEIAKMEFNQGLIPISVKRFLPKPEGNEPVIKAAIPIIQDNIVREEEEHKV